MRTAWIFELAPSSSAALLRAKLARFGTIRMCKFSRAYAR
jgi:hypothetical protein